MVARKDNSTENWKIPCVRIEGRELLAIIRDLVGSHDFEVTAENDEYKFGSIDDIEKNIELFKGDMNLSIGPIQATLSEGFMRGIRVRYGIYNLESNEAEALAKRFQARLTPFRSWLGYEMRLFGVTVLLAGFFSLIVGALALAGGVSKPCWCMGLTPASA